MLKHVDMLDLSKLDDSVRDQMAHYLRKSRNFLDSVVTIGADAKTSKGDKLGVRTAISYMAPHTLSGINMCPMAEQAQCHKDCLNTAGRGAMHSVQLSRLRRTLVLQQHPKFFYDMLHKQLEAHCKACVRDGVTPAYRPNGTTDKRWELSGRWWEMMEYFVNKYGLKIYDYTKIPNRWVPEWYDLTFSYSGTPFFKPHVEHAVNIGFNVEVGIKGRALRRMAVVFRTREMVQKLLEDDGTFYDLPVVDGDDTDVRFLDPNGVVVALYAKGKAKYDKTGFVVDI